MRNFFLFSSLAIFSLYPSFAQANDTKTPIPAQASKSEIKLEDKELEVKLKNVSNAVYELQKTVEDIIGEISQQEDVNVGQGNLIGPMIIPAIPVPTGTIAMGPYLKPRKKFLDRYSDQTTQQLTAILEHGMSLPDTWTEDHDLSEALSSIRNCLTELKAENDDLLDSMKGPKYDNMFIGKKAIKEADDLESIQKSLEACNKYVHKDIKQIDKAE